MSTDNMLGNQWDVFIDGDPSPFQMTVSVGQTLTLQPITTQRFGADPVCHMVNGRSLELSFQFQEWTIDDLKRWNGITANTAAVNKLPAVGTKMPSHNVRLHNANADDNSMDIVFPSVVFHGMGFNVDGSADAKQDVKATAQRDAATGDVVQIGYVQA